MSGKRDWTKAALKRRGFAGWVTFAELGEQLDRIATTGGVYVVVQGAGSKPDFLTANPGGRFKQRDPTVDAAALEANWVPGGAVVCIGKADNLRRRLREFMRFGAGAPIGHWGGRLIWQLFELSRVTRCLAGDPRAGAERGRERDAGGVPRRLREAAVRQRPAFPRPVVTSWPGGEKTGGLRRRPRRAWPQRRSFRS